MAIDLVQVQVQVQVLVWAGWRTYRSEQEGKEEERRRNSKKRERKKRKRGIQRRLNEKPKLFSK